MTEPLAISCTLATTAVPFAGQPRLVYLLIQVEGGKESPTLPANLALVVDCSESMHIRLVTDAQFTELVKMGQVQEVMTDGVPAWQVSDVPVHALGKFPNKLDYVVEALTVAAEYLRPTDQFSLVAFASQAQIVIPQQTGAQRAQLRQAARELHALKLGDETQMALGLALAFDEMQQCTEKSFAGRLILLTDGHTKNAADCYKWATMAREEGFTLSTLGVGSEFNEDLLIPLADMTGGSSYYIEKPDQIPAVFRQEMGAALSVSYHDVQVRLKLPNGVTFHRVHRVLPDLGGLEPVQDADGVWSIRLGNYQNNAPQTLLAELILPAWQVGSYRLLQANLAWKDSLGSPQTLPENQDLLIRVAETPSTQVNSLVMSVVEKVGAFRLGTQALKEAQQGDAQTATLRLKQAADALRRLGEGALADAMQRQAQTLAENGNLDPNATKKLRYETRHLTQRLSQ